MSKPMMTTHIDKQIKQVEKLMEPETYAKFGNQEKSQIRRTLQKLTAVQGDVAKLNTP